MSETITSISSPPPPSTYATVSFHKTNIIRLIDFPDDINLSLQPVIVTSWPLGLVSSGRVGEAYEFKVNGKPFGTVSGRQAVAGIRLLRNIFAFLHDRSWELVTPMTFSRRPTAKDTLIFRQLSPPLVPPSPVEWLALAPIRSDRLRVVYDVPDVKLLGADADHDYLGILITSIKRTLEGGDWFDKGDWSHDSFEFKLKGSPWLSRGEASNKTRILLLRLLETMERHGWKLHTAVLQRAGTDDIRMTDTWYFMRERKDSSKVSKAP